MLKGTRYAAANLANRAALEQVAALAAAGGPEGITSGSSHAGRAAPVSQQHEEASDYESESSEEEDSAHQTSKGKNRAEPPAKRK